MNGAEEQSPPSYDPSDAPPAAGDLPGYQNTAETLVVYTIGAQNATPLVSIAEIKAHLLLLAAFHRLHALVTEAEWWYNDKTTSLDFRPLPETKWALFITRAHHRFGLWLRHIVKRPSRTSGILAHLQKKEVPPLDVLLVLHAYRQASLPATSVILEPNIASRCPKC